MQSRLPLLLLAATLVLGGCPDNTASRHPQDVAEIAALRAELDGVRARIKAVEVGQSAEVASLEGRVRGLESAKQVVVQVSGAGIKADGARIEGPTGGMSTEPARDKPAPKPADKKPEVKPGAARAPRAGSARGLLTERPGYDTWNEHRPRATDERPKKGGTVRVRFSSQPKLLNAYLDNSAVTSYICDYIFDSLVDPDRVTFEMKPRLAESWDVHDMLFEIEASAPIEGIAFSAALQKWVKKDAAGKVEREYWPWEVQQTAEGLKLHTLKEHIGLVSESPEGFTVKDSSRPDAKVVATLPKAKVAGVNRGTVFTFRLRKDAKFHDGHPVTADDVVFTLATIKCEYVDAPSIRSYYGDVRPAQKIDDHTVRIIYSKQYFKAIEFAGWSVAVMPKHFYDPQNLLENDPRKFGQFFNDHPGHRAPLGSGAYKFAEWQHNKHVKVQRWDGFWGAERGGNLDSIVWKFIIEDQTALAALRAGEIDFLPEMSAEQFFKETKDPEFEGKLTKCVFYYGNFSYVGWNMRKAPFNDERVRTALAHAALDIPAFIRDVAFGAATQVAGSQYVFSPVYDKGVQPYPFDLEAARKLLREAGWFDRDGDGVIENAERQPFEFELLFPPGKPVYDQMATIMAENLKKLGITIKVRKLEWSVFLENIKSRQFDACALGWAQPHDESDPFQLWHSSGAEDRGSNHCGFGTPETDALILKIRETLDPGERRELFKQFQRILYKTQPYLFLYCVPAKAAYDPRFHGVRFSPIRPGYDLREWYDLDQR